MKALRATSSLQLDVQACLTAAPERQAHLSLLDNLFDGLARQILAKACGGNARTPVLPTCCAIACVEAVSRHQLFGQNYTGSSGAPPFRPRFSIA